MKINKYLLIALLYFFVDVVFLTPGLTYTTLLAPLFYYWIKKRGEKNVIPKFVLFLLPFIIVHLWNGVHLFYYFRSMALYFTIYIFCYAIYIFVRDKQLLEFIFKRVLIINFFLVLIAVIAFFTPLSWVFWTFRQLTTGIESFPRLEMFTFEPSYYSILFAPIAIYYTMKLLLKQYKMLDTVIYLIMIYLPLVLSFSLGVLGTLGLSTVLICLVNFRHLIRRKHFFYAFFTSIILVILVFTLLFIFYPENALFQRVENLASGKDTSGNGRTYEAVKMGWWIASEKSYLFGAGFGQIKVIGEYIIRNYYHYNAADIPIVTIPSATGETLAVFGVLGLLIKFGMELFLFFKTRTRDNYFREAVFIFIFIYQLTGSNLINVPEYVLWIIAFTPCCPVFDKPHTALKNR